MPLTPKGEKIQAAMKDQYGAKKGESVFYATKNAGKISGVEDEDADAQKGRKRLMDCMRKR